MDTITKREVLDLRGKTISTFIAYRAAGALQRVGDGGVVEVLTDDAAPILADLRAWAHACGHVVLGVEEEAGYRLVFTDLRIVEYLTFMEVMSASDIHIFV